MEQYRSEEEQVEALKKWWEENGRSIVVAVILALGLGFGWQGWQTYQQGENEAASSRYQAMLQMLSSNDEAGAQGLASEIKLEHSRSTYAQFAALHLARLAVNQGDLTTAEAELRWVLGRADSGSDTMQLAQLRLARVLASGGDPEQALTILQSADPGTYAAAYQVARGDILLMLAREDEAREAYRSAMMLSSRGDGQVNMDMLQQKLQSLSQVMPGQEAGLPSAAVAADDAIDSAIDSASMED